VKKKTKCVVKSRKKSKAEKGKGKTK